MAVKNILPADVQAPKMASIRKPNSVSDFAKKITKNNEKHNLHSDQKTFDKVNADRANHERQDGISPKQNAFEKSTDLKEENIEFKDHSGDNTSESLNLEAEEIVLDEVEFEPKFVKDKLPSTSNGETLEFELDINFNQEDIIIDFLPSDDKVSIEQVVQKTVDENTDKPVDLSMGSLSVTPIDQKAKIDEGHVIKIDENIEELGGFSAASLMVNKEVIGEKETEEELGSIEVASESEEIIISFEDKGLAQFDLSAEQKPTEENVVIGVGANVANLEVANEQITSQGEMKPIAISKQDIAGQSLEVASLSQVVNKAQVVASPELVQNNLDNKISKPILNSSTNSFFAEDAGAKPIDQQTIRGSNAVATQTQTDPRQMGVNGTVTSVEELPLLEGLQLANFSKGDSFNDLSNIGGQVLNLDTDSKLDVQFTRETVRLLDKAPDKEQQISLSIRHAMVSNKTQVSIKLYPETLGAIDVKLDFARTDMGTTVIKSIRISAEHESTLRILEKSQAELVARLSEVKGGDDASLKFDMRHESEGAFAEQNNADGKNQNNSDKDGLQTSDDLGLTSDTHVINEHNEKNKQEGKTLLNVLA